MPPPLAAMPGGHAPHRLAGAQNAADNVGGEKAGETRHVIGIDPHLRLQHAGIVHQRSQRPECGIDALEQAQNVGFGRNIGLDGDRGPARLLDVGHDLLGGRAVGDVAETDSVALCSAKPGDGRADTAAAAGNKQDLIHARAVQSTIARNWSWSACPTGG